MALSHTDNLRGVAALLLPFAKPRRGPAPKVETIMAAILLCRVLDVSAHMACEAVKAGDTVSRVTKLAAKLRPKLRALSPAILAGLDATCAAVTAAANFPSFRWRKHATVASAQLAPLDANKAGATAGASAQVTTPIAEPRQVPCYFTDDPRV